MVRFIRGEPSPEFVDFGPKFCDCCDPLTYSIASGGESARLTRLPGYIGLASPYERRVYLRADPLLPLSLRWPVPGLAAAGAGAISS